MDFCSLKSPSEMMELKFNMLLLLRNRYSAGIRASSVKDEYRRFFGKEINENIFDPLAIKPAMPSVRIMDDQILALNKDEGIFFEARKCCSDDEMQLIANAISSYKVTANNYVSIKCEVPESRYFNENVENQDYAPQTADLTLPVVIEPQDPLDLIPNNCVTLNHFEHNANVINENNATTVEIRNEQFILPFETPETNYDTEGHPDYIRIVHAGIDSSHFTHINPYESVATVKMVDSSSKKKKRGKKTIANKSVRKYTFQCSINRCTQSYRTQNLLKNHMELMHDGSVFCCSVFNCKSQFADKQLLHHHEQRCPLKAYLCEWEGCEKRFRTSKLLHGHLSAIHKRTMRDCSTPGCTQKFPNIERLKSHENRCRFKFDTMRQMESEGVSDESSPNSPEVKIII